MKATRMVLCFVGLIAGFAGIARADDPSPDVAAYKQKMHDCATQMKTDHPEMNHDARRKACRKQLGPSPKAPVAPSATAPTPAPPSP